MMSNFLCRAAMSAYVVSYSCKYRSSDFLLPDDRPCFFGGEILYKAIAFMHDRQST